VFRLRSLVAGFASLLAATTAQAGDDLVIPGFNTGVTVQSYLRLSNNDGAATTVRIRMHDAASGVAIGTWLSPTLPPGGTHETWAQAMLAASDPPLDMTSVPPVLVLSISGLAGHVQHATWTPETGTWAHVSTCGMVLMADPLSLPFVSGPARGLTGLVRLTNATAESRSLRVTFHDSAGTPFVWQSPIVPSYGAVTTAMSAIAREASPPIPDGIVSLMAMADAAPQGVALSYSEGLAGGTTFDDFSAACMSTIATPANPGDPPRTPTPAMPPHS
jgi:hypothetical protein